MRHPMDCPCSSPQQKGGKRLRLWLLTILTRSRVRTRMPLHALRASSHLEYDSFVLHSQALSHSAQHW